MLRSTEAIKDQQCRCAGKSVAAEVSPDALKRFEEKIASDYPGARQSHAGLRHPQPAHPQIGWCATYESGNDELTTWTDLRRVLRFEFGKATKTWRCRMPERSKLPQGLAVAWLRQSGPGEFRPT